MPNAWDRPAWPSIGNDPPDEIYLAVGRALSAWCEAEEAIAYLFSTVVEAGIMMRRSIAHTARFRESAIESEWFGRQRTLGLCSLGVAPEAITRSKF